MRWGEKMRFERGFFRGFWHLAATMVVAVFLLGSSTGCAHDLGDKELQPLAATAADLGRAVRRYAITHPDAATLDGQELVRQATSYDPSLLKPYTKLELVVIGRPQGVILVCTSDLKQGLFEDAVCSDAVDSIRWRDPASPCRFEVDLKAVCASP